MTLELDTAARGASPPATPRRPPLQRIASLWQERLFQNSAYLMANMVLGAACGFAFIAVLTRLFKPSEVGLVTTAISTTSLIGNLTALGLNYSLVRFLPERKDKAALINLSFTLVTGATILVTVLFLVLPGTTTKLYALGGAGFVAAFLAGNLVNAVKGLAENVFIAERSAGTIFRVNILSNVTKVGLPFAFVGLGAVGAYWAQTVALFGSMVLLLVTYARRRGHRFRFSLDRPTLKAIGRFSSAAYISTVLGGVPVMLLPLVVLGRFGSTQAAYWYTAIMVATLVFTLAGSIGQALFAEGANRPGELRRLALRSAGVMTAVMVPVVAVVIVAAPLGLAVFGRSYQHGALAPMRLLVASGLLVSVNFIAGTLLYLCKRIWTIVMINVVDLAVVVGLSLTIASDVTGVAVAWLIGEVFNVVLFSVAAWWAVRRYEREERVRQAVAAANSSGSTPSPAGAVSVSVDARYLKRPDVGISVYVAGVIDRLLESGADLTLLTDAAQHGAQLRRAYPAAEVVVLPARSGFVWEQRELPRYLRRARHGMHLAGANYGLPLTRVGGTRLALVVHDLIPLRMPRTYLFSRPAWAAKYLLSTLISLVRAELVLTPSAATASDVRRLRRTGPVEVRYPAPAAVHGHQAPPPADWPRPYVLYNGGLDPRKNVDGMLRAFALFRREGGEHHLVMLGSGCDRLAPRCRELGIEPFVHLPGYVDEATKTAAVRGADAVVYPSRWEGFGLPLLESMSVGTPVVTGVGGSLREVGGDAPIYVRVWSPRSIACGLTRAVRPEERGRFRARASAQLERFDGSASADPLVRYVSVVSEPAAEQIRQAA
jgi:O-antigen/teichoic acid export membrane protein